MYCSQIPLPESVFTDPLMIPSQPVGKLSAFVITGILADPCSDEKEAHFFSIICRCLKDGDGDGVSE
jgi:hypothetical protein